MIEITPGFIRATQETLEKLAARFNPSMVLEEAKAAARRAGVIDSEVERAAREVLARLRTRGIQTVDQLRSSFDQTFVTRIKMPADALKTGETTRGRIPALFGQVSEKVQRFGQALEQEIPFLHLKQQGTALHAEDAALFNDMTLALDKEGKYVTVTMGNASREFSGGPQGVLQAARWIREHYVLRQPLPPISHTAGMVVPPHGGPIEPIWIAVPQKVHEFGRSLRQKFDSLRFYAHKDGTLNAPSLGKLRMELDADGRNIRLTMGDASREFSAGPKGVTQASEWIRKHLK